MVWIKRNLFWVVFGTVTAIALGLGIYSLINAIQNNVQADNDVGEKKQRLTEILNQVPSVSDVNIQAGQEQLKRLGGFVASTKKFFPPVPYSNVKGVDFTKFLDSVVFDLRKRASAANTALPSKDYAFSFESQFNRTQFAPGSFPALAEHLEETKLICSLLFDSKISRLVGLRRPATADDSAQTTCCHKLPPVVIPEVGVVVNRYEVTFLTFSDKLAKVLDNIERSDKFLCAKALVVEPAETKNLIAESSPFAPPPDRVPPPAPTPGAVNPGEGRPGPGRRTDPASPNNPRSRPLGARNNPRLNPTAPPPPPPVPGVVAKPPASGATGGQPEGLKTMLDERLFKATLLLEVAKPFGK